MSKQLNKGDKVSWNSPQDEVKGAVNKKLTSDCDIKGHHVAASPENPEYLVVSHKTGTKAAHKSSALKKAG